MIAIRVCRVSTAKPALWRAVVAALLSVALSAFAATPERESLEYQVKASYLFNFLQFIKWPDDTFGENGKFNLCVVDAQRFGAALDPIAGERVGGREIVIHRLEAAAQAQQAKCHLLFIAAAGKTPPADVPPRHGLLTIGETPDFLRHGGVINLINVGGRVRFEINQDAAQEAGLVISSRLLALALK